MPKTPFINVFHEVLTPSVLKATSSEPLCLNSLQRKIYFSTAPEMPQVQTLGLKSLSVCLQCQQHIWQSWRRHVTSASSAHPDSQGLMTWKDTQSLYIWTRLPVSLCSVYEHACVFVHMCRYIFVHLQMCFRVCLHLCSDCWGVRNAS